MSIRLKGVPVYERQIIEIEAKRFNRVRLALLRLGRPLRFLIPGLQDVAMIIDGETWLCVDQSMSDLPIVAWTRFQTSGRTALHTPIICEQLYFHTHAALVAETAIIQTELYLSRALEDYRLSSVEPVMV